MAALELAESNLHDLKPDTRTFLSDVLQGLHGPPRSLPSKYFYDRRGSELFEQICELPEYYPTRTELAIMGRYVEQIVAEIGPNCLLIEYGSGSSRKTRMLLDHLTEPAVYVPVDISRQHLLAASAELQERYPKLEIIPVCADFTEPFELPEPERRARRRVVYFPGSTIGNFTPHQASRLLRQMAEQARGGALLLGVDLKKDREILERAYNDKAGVTAEFNLNLLEHINRELDADFDPDNFAHRAFFNEKESRIEMHLVSRCKQRVTIDGRAFRFAKGETIHTENSYKYDLDQFKEIAADAGLRIARVWIDDDRLFSVQLLTPLDP